MHSGATLNASQIAAHSSRPPIPPVVLLDGQLRTDLAVLEIDRRGPLDERTATLVVDGSDSSLGAGRSADLRRLNGRTVVIATPVALDGGQSRLRTELVGRIGGYRLDRADTDAVVAIDQWTDVLDRRAHEITKPRATVADVVASLDIGTDWLETSILSAEVPDSLTRAGTWRHRLSALCELFGLVVSRELRSVRDRVIE